MATPAVMSHDSATPATTEDQQSFFFDNDDLDLQLHPFPAPKTNSSRMGEQDEEPAIQPHGQELQVPTHPIPSMQAAFAESMLDAFDDNGDNNYYRLTEPAARRKLLLEQDIGDETHAGRWKQKPGQRYHELWKLVAQISFGIYLLLNGMARDDDQALNILQKHVDEVDSFLEQTVEDFDLAQDDIEARLKNLKLPLENIHIFDGMLEDRAFRNTIVQGNETIEHIITRTASAMNDSLRSVQQGMEATREFKKYMSEMENNKEWQEDRPTEKMKLFEKLKLFDAMNGNADGWYKAFVMLQTKGNHLGVSLVQLGTIVAEIDKRAAEISRKSRFSLAMSPSKSTTNSTANSTRSAQDSPSRHSRKVSNGRSFHSAQSGHSRSLSLASLSKNLPADPNMITPAIAATLPAFQLVGEREKAPQSEEDDEESDSGEQTLQFLTLQPRTYTPPPLTPSRYTPPTVRTEVQRPTPTHDDNEPLMAIPEKSSLRKRLSKQQKSTPPPLLTTATYSSSNSQKSCTSTRASSASSNNRAQHSRTRSQSMSNIPQHRNVSSPSQASQRTVPISQADRFPSPPTISFVDDRSSISRSGSPLRQHPRSHHSHSPNQHLLSEYTDYISDPHATIESRASLAGNPSMEYHAFIASAQPTRLHDFNTGNYVSSPRSEQQMTFQPVMASPHSPLQRPWTAADDRGGFGGMGRDRPAILGANGHSYSANAMLTVNHNSSGYGYGSGNIRGSNMSQMTRASEAPSGVTLGIGPDGRKIKKKRSGFGWLKKAFALSEEEKAEFEEKRRRDMAEEEEWRRRQPRERVFLDGRRVDRHR